jgi:hypothetical protein
VRREDRGDPGGGASLHKEVVRKALAHAHRAALTVFVLAVSSAGLARDKDNRADAATLKARQHFFGPENVDPVSAAVRKDRVILAVPPQHWDQGRQHHRHHHHDPHAKE